MWRCVCDCGVTKDKRACNLLTGHTTSCGCFSGGPLASGEAEFNGILYRYKLLAGRRGYCFTLTDEQFRALTKGECHYCGSPPSQVSRGRNSNGDYVYNGIDRLNNSDGYTTENAVSCCFTCNDMKGKLDEHAFIERILAIAARVSKLEGGK